MMRSEAPLVAERLEASYLSYVQSRSDFIQRSGGIVLRRVYTDDSGMFEIVEISVEDIETSSFLRSERDTMFVSLKGCWAVGVDGKFREVDEHSSIVIPKAATFRISPGDVAAKALLVINGSR